MAKLKRALRTFDSASLTGTPQNLGAVIDFAVSKAAIINTSDVDVLISDGSTEDDIRVPANATVNVGEGVSSYGQQRSTGIVFSANTQLQIEQVTGAGTGDIVLNLFG